MKRNLFFAGALLVAGVVVTALAVSNDRVEKSSLLMQNIEALGGVEIDPNVGCKTYNDICRGVVASPSGGTVTELRGWMN